MRWPIGFVIYYFENGLVLFNFQAMDGLVAYFGTSNLCNELLCFESAD